MGTKKKSAYKVKWEIELDAYNELDAAQLALQIQRDEKSMATNFEVTKIGFGETTNVDLNNG